jgi:hypothetical protein
MLCGMSPKEVWVERVRAWRQSGQSGPAFAADKEFTGSALRYWASRVDKAPAGGGPLTLARVVRTDTAKVTVLVGTASVVVAQGFDPDLLRDVVYALGDRT